MFSLNHILYLLDNTINQYETKKNEFVIINLSFRKLFDPPEIDLPIFLKLSFDELNQYIANHKHRYDKNIRILKALSINPKYIFT